MKLIQFDSLGGASGDMILAALLDTGLKVDALRKPLASLPVHGFRLVHKRVAVDGHSGSRAHVELDEHEHHPHRTLRTIRAMIRKSALSAGVKTMAIAVFENLAVAEGRVHRMPPEEVHFHEVGAVDSIVDIVGACLALELLAIDAVEVGPLPYGTGTIDCAHGIIPVPAPATVRLLMGHPLVRTDEPFELVTPTGAALLMTWKKVLAPSSPIHPSSFIPHPLHAITATGTGFGMRKLNGRPNMLRAVIFEPASADATLHDECLELACNLDDMTPEHIGALTQRLLAAGALDVFTTPVQMKKQRPGVLLTVLTHAAQREPLLDLLFRESTTFGVREHTSRRTMLERRFAKARTPYGIIRIKEGIWKGKVVTRSPEHDDCAKAADHHQVPLRTVYDAARQSSRPAHGVRRTR